MSNLNAGLHIAVKCDVRLACVTSRKWTITRLYSFTSVCHDQGNKHDDWYYCIVNLISQLPITEEGKHSLLNFTSNPKTSIIFT